MSTPKIVFQIDLTPDNDDLIQAIRDLVAGNPSESAPEGKAKGKSKARDAKEGGRAEDVTLDDIKAAAKEAKATFGNDFAHAVLDDFEVREVTQLGRRISAIEEEDYAEIIQAWADGPQDDEADEDEDDFDDEEDEAEITADSVKIALKAYAKEVGRDDARKIMTKHGAASLTKVAECTPKQLAAMMKALV